MGVRNGRWGRRGGGDRHVQVNVAVGLGSKKLKGIELLSNMEEKHKPDGVKKQQQR